jgi:hypothetical protein
MSILVVSSSAAAQETVTRGGTGDGFSPGLVCLPACNRFASLHDASKSSPSPVWHSIPLWPTPPLYYAQAVLAGIVCRLRKERRNSVLGCTAVFCRAAAGGSDGGSWRAGWRLWRLRWAVSHVCMVHGCADLLAGLALLEPQRQQRILGKQGWQLLLGLLQDLVGRLAVSCRPTLAANSSSAVAAGCAAPTVPLDCTSSANFATAGIRCCPSSLQPVPWHAVRGAPPRGAPATHAARAVLGRLCASRGDHGCAAGGRGGAGSAAGGSG